MNDIFTDEDLSKELEQVLRSIGVIKGQRLMKTLENVTYLNNCKECRICRDECEPIEEPTSEDRKEVVRYFINFYRENYAKNS